jgi:hypothetical protein
MSSKDQKKRKIQNGGRRKKKDLLQLLLLLPLLLLQELLSELSRFHMKFWKVGFWLQVFFPCQDHHRALFLSLSSSLLCFGRLG